MRLSKLQLRNFKGVRDFTLEADSAGDVEVWGDNATGKTTLFDAFTWLLFDKDSANHKDFEIKTLDAEGKAIPGIDHEVAAVLQRDFDPLESKALTLRKVYSEKWTKKRGSAKAEFTGHTTDHWVNGVPVPKGEYQDSIAKLIDEDAFRLLTNPRHFPEVLSWQKRRELVMVVCGDVSDADVIASDKQLADLPDILGDRSLEDHRKVISGKRTEINKQLQQVPTRIDEANRATYGLPALPDGVTENDIRFEIGNVKAQRQEKEREKATLESGGAVAEKTKQLREVEAQLLELANKHRAKLGDSLVAENVNVRRLIAESDTLKSNRRSKEHLIEEGNESIERLDRQTKLWRTEFKEINAKVLAYDLLKTCPICGQDLPEDQIVAAYNKAHAIFNQNKSTRLEGIQTQGKEAGAKVAVLLEANVTLKEEIKALDEKIKTQGVELEKMQAKIAALEDLQIAYAENPEYVAKGKERATLGDEIIALKSGNAEALSVISSEIAQLDEVIQGHESTLAQVAQREKGLGRVKDLKAEERTLAAEYEALEKELYLTEQFVRSKVRLLEDRINSRFKYARFKMFNVLVNGGIEECCEVLYKGVPYSTALNKGAQHNIGLDIINTLSEHYKVTAPIFIDNAEAVSRLLPTTGQQVRLYVSEPDKVLRVERP